MLPAPTVPAPVSGAVDAVRGLANQPRTGPADRAALLVGLRQIIDAAEAAFTDILAEFDAAGDGQVLHAAASTPAWLRGALGMAASEASERVRIARAAHGELAPTMAAMHSDDSDAPTVSFEHVRTIHRTLRTLPPSSRDEAREALTALAHQVSVDDLRAAGRYLRHVVDPDGSARHAEEDFGRRWLSIAPLLDGMHSISGVLDAETAARLNTALAPFLVPTGPSDERSTDQRRADGLADIVHAAVRAGELPDLSGADTALQVDVPAATLLDGAPDPARLVGTSATPTWLTSITLGRLACDASVRRLLVSPDGQPIDLGRSVRVFSTIQRRALAHRDNGCRFPGCDRPPAHTDAHHLVPWMQGGASDLANGLLLCRFHHRQVQEGGWSITSTELQANGPLTFAGPAFQRLESPAPKARGPSP